VQFVRLQNEYKNVSAPVGLATYDQDLADKVYSIYREDFERLGYDRDSWRDGQSDVPAAQKAVIPEARFYDEIIERNIIISGLYAERDRLRADLKRVSRLHLMPLVNGLASLRRSARALVSKMRGAARAKSGARR